ncbi:glutaredoxin [[Pantoea] beijingensis]|uniref:Glutaredoxin-like protein NrdH n=1 Tax=[Pantoea] beijingensis TaxID=1324864 RepID=A0A443IFW9_9GAMM|nr:MULTISPECIES: glutaredoxin-like protein NrdH [Erwiniaceae]RWR02920.1 glutaredoxin [[Pantoea] beijingensis]
MTIIIYTKDNCVQCNATKNAMDKRGFTYQLVNIDTHPDEIETLKSLGYRQLPVVMTEEQHWSGFRPDKISALATRPGIQG